MVSQNTNNPGKGQELNLQQLAQDFMSGMQRHFDMLAFNLASREAVNEADYNRISHAVKIMPAAKQHQNFEQTQAYARDLLLRQLVNDALNLAVSLLHSTHLFLALVKCTQGKPELAQEKQEAVEAMQKSFVQAQLDDKFDRLEKDFSIRCELEDTITSLAFCMQVLIQNKGEVTAAQTDENGELALDLKSIKLKPTSEPDAQPTGQIVDYRKVFREKDFISFNDTELQLILVSISVFADMLFKSTANYTQSLQEGN